MRPVASILNYSGCDDLSPTFDFLIQKLTNISVQAQVDEYNDKSFFCNAKACKDAQRAYERKILKKRKK